MNSSNENLDPHSLSNPSILVPNSVYKLNDKQGVHKGFSSVSGLRESSLSNISTEIGYEPVDHTATQLPTPPSSQSLVTVHDKALGETRLPISPPPEEVIRVKELSALGHTEKNQSRLPLPSRKAPSASFKFPAEPKSFARYEQQSQQHPNGRQTSTASADAASASSINTLKRARSVIPPYNVPPSTSAPSSSKNGATPIAATISLSPNPKPRKHPKVHDSGIYAGSGFKRRHNRGTSTESLDASEVPEPLVPRTSTLKSPARKKRAKDRQLDDYTPQRERVDGKSPTKRRPRPRRSATPDVPYEPPAEQFTPPRHVVLQPPLSTASTRPRKPRQSSVHPDHSVERKIVKVKPERLTSPFPLPSLDLLKPMAPPSPTDDPILLTGAPQSARSSGKASKTLVDVGVGSDIDGLAKQQEEPSAPYAVNESGWHMAPDPGEETALMDLNPVWPSQFDATFDPASHSDTDSDDEVPPHATAFHGHSPGLDPDKSTGSHIFHLDDDEVEREAGEDEGDYTGRFKFYSVPVKQDPPSSATRVRRESWGRPISPFPFRRRASVSQDEETGSKHEDTQSDDESVPPSPSDGRRRPAMPKHMKGSASLNDSNSQLRNGGFTLSEMEARLRARNAAAGLPLDEEEQVESVETDGDVRSGDILEKSRRNAMIYDDENEDEDTESGEKDIETVEREVTPMKETESIDNTDNETGLSKDENPHWEAALPDERAHPLHTAIDQGEIHKDSASEHEVDERDDTQHPVVSLNQDCASEVIDLPSPSRFTEHSIALRNDDDSSSDDEAIPTRIVEISSDDPKAAARAAAILKLHHSYILDGAVAHRARHTSPSALSRRRSYAVGDEVGHEHQNGLGRARRKSIANSSGLSQHRARQASPLPRAQLLFLPPESPAGSAFSAEDALLEAETQIRAASASPFSHRVPIPPRPVDVRPLQNRSRSPSPEAAIAASRPHEVIVNKQEWTKLHWKRLDTCFTDLRVEMAKEGALEVQLAEVDDVDLDAVVDRFLDDEQEDWNRDMLLRRVTALLARQRAGKGAPPSPCPIIGGGITTEHFVPLSPSPAWGTPVPPSEISVPTKLPPSLLAPRYAHLLQEATANTVEQPLPVSSRAKEPDTGDPKHKAIATVPADRKAKANLQSKDTGPSTVPASATKRVLNYLGNFLGRGAPAKTTNLSGKTTLNALPLPPEMRQMARGPVTTPAKKPIPKSQAPRELVQLAQTQIPPKPSAPPKTKSAREMVSLNHIDPPRSAQRPRSASVPIVIPGRMRKDSGGSVKDLIRSFEEVQKRTELEVVRSGSRVVKRKLTGADNLGRAPWKP